MAIKCPFWNVSLTNIALRVLVETMTSLYEALDDLGMNECYHIKYYHVLVTGHGVLIYIWIY